MAEIAEIVNATAVVVDVPVQSYTGGCDIDMQYLIDHSSCPKINIYTKDKGYTVESYPEYVCVTPSYTPPSPPAPEVYPETVYPETVYPETVYPETVYPEAVYPEAKEYEEVKVEEYEAPKVDAYYGKRFAPRAMPPPQHHFPDYCEAENVSQVVNVFQFYNNGLINITYYDIEVYLQYLNFTDDIIAQIVDGVVDGLGGLVPGEIIEEDGGDDILPVPDVGDILDDDEGLGGILPVPDFRKRSKMAKRNSYYSGGKSYGNKGHGGKGYGGDYYGRDTYDSEYYGGESYGHGKEVYGDYYGNGGADYYGNNDYYNGAAPFPSPAPNPTPNDVVAEEDAALEEVPFKTRKSKRASPYVPRTCEYKPICETQYEGEWTHGEYIHGGYTHCLRKCEAVAIEESCSYGHLRTCAMASYDEASYFCNWLIVDDWSAKGSYHTIPKQKHFSSYKSTSCFANPEYYERYY